MRKFAVWLMASLWILPGCFGMKDLGSGNKSGNLQAVNEPPPELLLKDKIKNYASAVGKDPAEIERIFGEKLGVNPPTDFNEAWFSFFVATDPALAGMETFLPKLWLQTLLSGVRPGPQAAFQRPEHADAGEEGPGTVQQGQGSEDPPRNMDEVKSALHGFHASLLLVQGRFLQDAAFFKLSVEPALPGAFPLPERFFASESLNTELKEGLGALLYAASLKAGGDFYSFFKFSEELPAGGPRPTGLGKLIFFPAKENVMPRQFRFEPQRL